MFGGPKKSINPRSAELWPLTSTSTFEKQAIPMDTFYSDPNSGAEVRRLKVRNWFVDKGQTIQEPKIIETLRIGAESTEAKKISWANSKFDERYNAFREQRFEAIKFLQEKIKSQIQQLEVLNKENNSPQDLETKIETELNRDQQAKAFAEDCAKYVSLVKKMFEKFDEKIQNKVLISKFIDPEKLPAFSSLISRYVHNTRAPLGTISNCKNIINFNPDAILSKNLMSMLVNNLKDCFQQVDRLFIALTGPSEEAKPEEIDINQYVNELKERYESQASANQVSLNFVVDESLRDLQTFTTDTVLIDQVLNNLVLNPIEHFDRHSSLERRININLKAESFRGSTIIKAVVSNPTTLSQEKIAQLAQFQEGLTEKDKFSGTSPTNGRGLTSSKLLCQTALGGDLEINKDSPSGYFETTLTLQDLAKKANVAKVAAAA